jgi:hypothetical protein
MDWRERALADLPEHLDAHGDLVPPWERFPTYDRETIWWRMGAGEGWLLLWSLFLERLPPTVEARLGYLRRHAPAPVPWADYVVAVLDPTGEGDDDDPELRELHRRYGYFVSEERLAALVRDGLVASDVAYRTWLEQQRSGVAWPWTYCKTPEQAARWRPRELWFWSRQVAALRADPGWTPPPVPRAWRACAGPLATGHASDLRPRHGLLTLAQLLAAGSVEPPWRLGLSPKDFTDSYGDDMGYVDAYRLWLLQALDDREQVERFVRPIPAAWAAWCDRRVHVR